MELRALGSRAGRDHGGLFAPGPGVRKTVTILFADLVDSTRLSLSLDPEAVWNLLTRYFDEMSAIVHRHGGTVEKYIGDAIMAVFGVPTLHEDDALRALRAAVEMRDTLAALNPDLEAVWGVRLANRIGVNTGEVIVGDHRKGHQFVTGEPVNSAKRLEEAAATDEILIGQATYQFVRDTVTVRPSGPRALKHGQAVDAFTVLDIPAHAPDRAVRVESPFIGREHSRATMATVFDDAIRTRACHLLTVLGDAGVGKSRLLREFTAELAGSATVIRGHCLPYGEGITYWPLAGIVRDIARASGSDPGDRSAAAIAMQLAGAPLAGEEKAELIAKRVAEALGLDDAGGGGTSEETFWAVRRLFEALARTGPLVVVVDDLHWAEPTFLDLLEHVADHARDSPILLVGIARPDLLDARPGWAGRRNGTAIRLDPLSDSECHELISNLLGHLPLPLAASSMIANAAQGNALFAEELVAMLVDDGLLTREDDRWVASPSLSEMPVPSTINALLAARLEGLPADQRAILTTASVEGVVFHRSAVGEFTWRVLDASLEYGLQALVGRDLIREETADLAGQQAFRFRHVLIRDAAYRSLSKKSRSDLHERYAAWLEATACDRVREFEEIVGYHLEQAFLYRTALASPDSRATTLAARASDRLEAAGRRALARSDLPAGIGLLERVTRLLSADQRRRTLLLAELGAALIEAGRLADAEPVLDEAQRRAADLDDARAAAHVLVQQQFLRLLHVEKGRAEETSRVTALVIPVFESHADNLGLCRARRLQAWLHWNAAHADAAGAAWARAAAHARSSGDRHVHDEILTWIASSLWFGPTPADEGIRRCEAMLAEVRGSPEADAAILRHLAGLHAMLGRFDVARRLVATSNAAYAELGLTLNAATSQNEAVIELLAGNPVAAERSLRAGYRALDEMGDRMFLPTTAAFLARALLQQGRDEEAEHLADLSARLAGRDDLLTQILWRGVRARLLARRAEPVEAEALARAAVTLAGATDFVNHRADAFLDLSYVLEASHERSETVAAASEALRLYESKGNAVAAATTRRRLNEVAKA